MFRRGAFRAALIVAVAAGCSRSTPAPDASAHAGVVATPAAPRPDVGVSAVRVRVEPADEAHGRPIPLRETLLRIELAGGTPVDVAVGCLDPLPVDPPKHVAVAFVGLVSCYATGATDYLGIVEKAPGTYAIVTWVDEEEGPDEARATLSLANLEERATVRARPGLRGPVVVRGAADAGP